MRGTKMFMMMMASDTPSGKEPKKRIRNVKKPDAAPKTASLWCEG
jgi:hypothetical protein